MRYVQLRLDELAVAEEPNLLWQQRKAYKLRSSLLRYRPPRKYPDDATHKNCTKCGVSKPLDAFNPFINGALGRSSRCKECLNAIGKEYTRANRERRAGRPRPAYCECCGQDNTVRNSLHFDHDHASGRFRGWICHGCNVALGVLKDDINRLELLIIYLKNGGS
jgi:hypothetical protein